MPPVVSNAVVPPPGVPITGLPPGGTMMKAKKPKREDTIESLVGVDTIETVSAANVENEIKKLFGKVC
jgi:hypothetical protein